MPSITGFVEIDEILWLVFLGFFIVFLVEVICSHRNSKRKGISEDSHFTPEMPQSAINIEGSPNKAESWLPTKEDTSTEDTDPLLPVGNMRRGVFDRLFGVGPVLSKTFWSIFFIPFLIICLEIGDLLADKMKLELLGHILLSGIVVYIVSLLLANHLPKD